MIKKAVFAVIFAMFLSFFNCITTVSADIPNANEASNTEVFVMAVESQLEHSS